MFSLLSKIFPKNLAGILGIVQLIIPALRAVVMATLRLLAILMPAQITEKLIVKVKNAADKIEGGFDKVKRLLLGLAKIV